MPDRVFRDNAEPSIDELLSDPIAELLRRRDRIAIDDVLAAVDRAKTGLRRRRLRCGCTADAVA